MVKIERGEIWWADLGRPMGSEPSLRRPVLIVQDDRYNRSKIATVIVISITSNTRLAELPGNIPLNPNESGLPKSSVINVSQLTTIDKRWLERKVSRLPRMIMEEINFGLGLILGLN